jgi:hypothetical protein
VVKIFTSHRVLQACLELDFLFECVFPGMTCVTRLSDCEDASCVVYLEYDLDLEICRQLSQDKNLIIYHLGDETAIKDLSGYDFAKAIFRNYFHHAVFSDSKFKQRLYWTPNGFRNGLGNRSELKPKSAIERQVLASFIGWLSNPKAVANERATFQQASARCDGLLQCIPTQGFAGGFSPHLYKVLLEDAVFAPCPAGNAAETIRLFDAMECGCIPISLRHPFLEDRLCMGNPPIQFLDRWEDLPELLHYFHKVRLENPAQITTMQDAVIDYWDALKLNLKSRVRMHKAG